jgi:hypothetical protein
MSLGLSYGMLNRERLFLSVLRTFACYYRHGKCGRFFVFSPGLDQGGCMLTTRALQLMCLIDHSVSQMTGCKQAMQLIAKTLQP